MWPKHSTEKEIPNLERYRHNSKEKAKREKERGPYKQAKPYNLLIIALFACILEVAPMLQVYMQ